MGESAGSAASVTVQVIDTRAEGVVWPIVQGSGRARAVLGPHNGARFRSFHVIELERGDSTIDLTHSSDCVYYVVGGVGAIVDLTSGERSTLVEGAMVHIDAGDSYRLQSEGDVLRLVGGPCPPDPRLYAPKPGEATTQPEV